MHRQKMETAQFEDDMEHDCEDDDSDYPKECFGCYAPGTEECDWCEFSDECAA